MSCIRFKVIKLIRDRQPDFMRAKGIVFHERTLEQEEYFASLKAKILEEAEEVQNTSNAEELTEELADLLEVAESLAHAKGVTLQQIQAKPLEKRQARGGFEKRLFIQGVEIEESNPAIRYFLERPSQYPRVEHLPDCIFCQLGKQKTHVLAKFTHCYVIEDKFPVSKGHLLIIPDNHTENWFTATEEVRIDMMKTLHLMKDRLDSEYSPQGYNIGANCGETAGQSVMHLHLHLIPRYQGDMEEPKGGVRGVISAKQNYCDK